MNNLTIKQDLAWLLADKATIERFIEQTPPEDVIDLASWQARLSVVESQIKEKSRS